MSYLRGTEINEIAKDVRLLSIEEIDDISHYLFDSKVKEYHKRIHKLLKCKKIFYDYIDKSFILAYNNGEKIEGGHHNEV